MCGYLQKGTDTEAEVLGSVGAVLPDTLKEALPETLKDALKPRSGAGVHWCVCVCVCVCVPGGIWWEGLVAAGGGRPCGARVCWAASAHASAGQRLRYTVGTNAVHSWHGSNAGTGVAAN